MSEAKLADAPRDDELEDYVTALFQVSGHFVEKSVKERDFTEILELDCVATSYTSDPPTSLIVEVKSGKWGFPDVFKIIGWMRYLNFSRSAFFYSRNMEKHDETAVQGKVGHLGLTMVHLADFKSAATKFQSAGFPAISSVILFEVFRFSYWMERRLYHRFRQRIKKLPKRAGITALIHYDNLVSNGIFFTPDVVDRLRALYDAYKEHPRLSLGIAIEAEGGDFDPAPAQLANSYLKDALNKGVHEELQLSLFSEHRARLAILKAAIDFVSLVDAGIIKDRPASGKISLGDPYIFLPQSFHAGLKTLRRHRYFKRYALFWQVFLWGFGGFLLEDREKAEFKLLSDITGIPVTEIPNALSAFDTLFQGSWLFPIKDTPFRGVKMIPSCFRGIGCYLRLEMNKVSKYSDLGYTAKLTEMMGKWNNIGYDVLVNDIK